jgi:ABC-type nitrate/sulfonate/bicarbonate transport system ATPase subunit
MEKMENVGNGGNVEKKFWCRDISKCYGGEPVIRGVSLDLSSGGFISLLGHSGVGKTTLFNVLSGVDRPDEGRVYLSGEEITGIPGRVSYMLQKDLLLEYRTVLDNVILPLVLRRTPVKEARLEAAEILLLSDAVYIMSGKPGKITRRFDIAPIRAQTPDFPASGEYASLRKQILATLSISIES